MTYTFIFATLAQYTAAKSAGGSIYNALRTSMYLSRTAVSMIQETGEVITDTMNFIDVKESLAVGDFLLYRASDQTFWALKSTGSWGTAPNTRSYSTSELNSAGYVKVGQVYYRDGIECIIGNQLPNLYAFSDITPFPDNIVPSGTLSVKVSLTSEVLRARGILNGNLASKITTQSTVMTGVFPVNATMWDAALADGSTITYIIGNTEYTITPSNYNGTYMDFVNERMLVVYPDNRPGSILFDMNGQKNTKALVNSGYSVPGAEAAYSFGVDGVPGYGQGRWWLPSVGEAAKIIMAASLPTAPYMNSWMTSNLRNSGAYYDIYVNGGLYERSLATQSPVLAISYFSVL